MSQRVILKHLNNVYERGAAADNRVCSCITKAATDYELLSYV